MTQRKRHATRNGGTAVLEPPRPAAPAAPAAPDTTPDLATLDDFVRKTSPAQRDDFLALARRQGFLYPHQVPLGRNGHRPEGEEATRWTRLTHLLAGDAELEPVHEVGFEPLDAGLDARQRQAVSRALGTPDLALIVGRPGTGKSRVVAEILTQAALRGERALLVAPQLAAIDHLLPLVAGRDAVCAVRLLDPGERPESLPSVLQGLTVPQRSLHLKEQVLSSARRCQEAADSQRRQRHQEEALWPRLQNLAEQAEHLDHRRQDLQHRLSRVTADIEAEIAEVAASADRPPTRFARELRGSRHRHAEALKQNAEQRAQATNLRDEAGRTLQTLDAERTALRPLALAKQAGRWWTLAWWRATLRGQVPARFAEVERKYQEALQARAALEQQLQNLEALAAQLEHEHAAAQGSLKSTEIERRRQTLSAEAAPLEQAYQKLHAQWSQLVGRLEDSLRPAALSTPALDAAHLAWQNRRCHDEEQCKFAQQWTAFLQHACGPAGERLLPLVNLVAGTTQALAEDRHFAACETFDLLVVEDADRISEAEFLKLARRAHRWVLVGEPAWEYSAGYDSNLADRIGILSHSRIDPAHARAALPEPFAFLQKVWQLLHWDPQRLPYAWTREGERLCCRLRPVLAEQRRWLESEPLADSPEIELRILSLPRTEPVLAEVVFGPTTTLEQAKQYIYRELQEVAVQTAGRHATLAEESDCLVLRLADPPATQAVAVTLAPGLRECLMPLDERTGNGAPRVLPRTARFEFDKNAGWSRAAVLGWAKQHLGFRDPGRSVRLEVLHRMRPELAKVVANLLFADETSEGSNTASALRLVAVPPLRSHDGRAPRDRGKGLTKPSLPREGAGLEQDLSLPRHGDRLPTELRAHLPGSGIVNFLEAQALVRTLEELHGHGAGGKHSPPSVAVVAFSAAQAELIRLLARRSPILKAAADLPIGLPTRFAQQEFERVLVSLTRSHSHRAVALAAQFDDLVLAFSRARNDILVFADLGTLVRRSHFFGRLENLDEAASAREARFAVALVHAADRHAGQ